MTSARSPLMRLAAAITGLTFGIGVGLMMGDRNVGALGMTLFVAAGCVLMLRVLPPHARRSVGAIVLLGFGLRVASAVVLYTSSMASGRAGFIVGDDANYAAVSWAFVQYLQGHPQPPYVPPKWHGEDYLFGTFVYLESAVFAVLGPNVLAVEILNGGLASVTVILIYDLVRRTFDHRPALVTSVAVALYPSLVLWSALNLKDAVSLLFIASVLWLTLRLQLRPRWWWLAAICVVLLPLESLRRHVFVSLAIVVPVAVAVMPRETLLVRLRWVVAMSVAGAVLVVGSAVWNQHFGARASAGLVGLEGMEQTRQNMAIGARTAFADEKVRPVEPPPSREPSAAPGPSAAPEPSAAREPSAAPGPSAAPEPSAAREPSAAPGPSAAPAPSPATTFLIIDGCDPSFDPGTASRVADPPTHYVGPRTKIVLETARAPETPAGVQVEYVRAGDLVVIGDPGALAAPVGFREALSMCSRMPVSSIQFVERSSGEALVLTRTLTYIPKGLAYAFLAPFPWDLGRDLDYLTVPEMILWYAILALVPYSLWIARSRWRRYAGMLLFVVGMFALLTLAEGNVGTLYRHRAMPLPFTIALASYGIVRLWDRFREVRDIPAVVRTSRTPIA